MITHFHKFPAIRNMEPKPSGHKEKHKCRLWGSFYSRYSENFAGNVLSKNSCSLLVKKEKKILIKQTKEN